MSIYIELLLVAVIVVYIVALSGWTQTWIGWLSHFRARYGYSPVKSLRPFSCAQCMTWWCCLLWAVLRGKAGLPTIAASAGLAWLSLTIENIMIFIHEGLLWCIRRLQRFLDK